MTLVWGVILFLTVLIMFIYCILPTKSAGVIEAEKARLLRKESSDKKKVDNILKPVFKKIDKASRKGESEIAIFKHNWFIQDKIQYQKALQELRDMDYKIRFDYTYYCVIISW